MPDRCCVTECQSNYDSTSDEYISVFRFPENELLKKEWTRKIPRKNFTPNKRSVVCEKHFESDLIIRYDEFPSNGDIIKLKRSRPKLKEGSILTLFPGCPAYLSSTKKATRISRDEKLQKRDDDALKTFLENDKISTYEDIQKLFSSKITNISNNTLVLHFNSFTCILFMSFEGRPNVSKSINIKLDLTVEVFVGEQKLHKSDVSSFLVDNSIKLWSQLENLINAVNVKTLQQPQSSHYETAVEEWNLHVSENKSTEEFKKKQFLHEQMLLSSKPKAARRYTTDMYRFASCLYIISPACYKALQNCKVLTLPCVDSLKKLLNVLSLDSRTLTVNSSYVKAKCEKLKEEEKLVNLLIDEIHVNSKVTYKGRHITGFAENKDCVSATAVQAFMISSVFSSFKEIVALVPVHKMTVTDLLKLTKAALFMLHEAGFEVLSIISDNNSVNRNMFSLLANGGLTSSPIQNPANGANLYLLFDAVHILKCIRNNWLNQADSEKTFICPEFTNDKTVSISPSENRMRPRFGLLRQLYNLEKDSSVKYAFRLTAKSLYPTNLERQNVLPAVNVFHETNPAALERLSKQNPTIIHTVEGTSAFLKLIKKWWDIMNVSHKKKECTQEILILYH